MRTIQVEPYWNEEIQSVNLNDAIYNVGPAPCDKCERKTLCKEEEVECKAFRVWVNNGTKWNPSKLGHLLRPVK
jgi:hypothetical protein